MKKFQITIPEPCHEDWSQMSKEEKGRFCGSCKKTVVDFTSMNDRQLAEFFKKPVGSVCGRLTGDQIQRDIMVPPKRIPWVKYFFSIALPAFFISMKAGAQGKVQVMRDTIENCTTDTTGKLPEIKADLGENLDGMLGMIAIRPIDEFTVTGKVIDEKGYPVSHASIIIKHSTGGVTVDSIGNFSIRVKASDILVISAVGLQTQEVKVNRNRTEIVLPPMEEVLMGDIIIVQRPKAPSQEEPTKIKTKKPLQNLENTFNVYPNPVKNGGMFFINSNGIEEGEYLMDIHSSSGEIVFSRKLIIDQKAKMVQEQVPSNVSGMIWIRMRNLKTGKEYSRKIVVG